MTNILNCTDETSFTNFSSITESTRIMPKSKSSDCTIIAGQDISCLSSDTILEYNNNNNNNNSDQSLTSQINPLKIDRRGETSNWIKDLEDDNSSIVSRPTDLEPGTYLIKFYLFIGNGVIEFQFKLKKKLDTNFSKFQTCIYHKS